MGVEIDCCNDSSKISDPSVGLNKVSDSSERA